MRHAGLTRCPWCGARNYTIDTWCTRCEHFLDWAPPGRRYHRGLAFLSAAAAVTGLSLLLAMPAAGWVSGSRPTVSLNFSNVRLPVQASTSQDEPAHQIATRPTPNADPGSPAVSTPPANIAQPAPTDMAQPAPTDIVQPAPTALPAPQPQPALATRIGAPTDAVSRFYAAISAHNFDVAADLWTEQMQQRNPPTVFIDERFSGTERIDVATERLLSIGSGTAIVYVDVNELIGGLSRRWVGTWQVVDMGSGWLLNNADLQPGA